MRKSCVAICANHLTVLKAMDAMTKLGIAVVSTTDSGYPFTSLTPREDRFLVFGLAESEDQIYKLSLDFSVDPQLDPPV